MYYAWARLLLPPLSPAHQLYINNVILCPDMLAYVVHSAIQQVAICTDLVYKLPIQKKKPVAPLVCLCCSSEPLCTKTELIYAQWSPPYLLVTSQLLMQFLTIEMPTMTAFQPQHRVQLCFGLNSWSVDSQSNTRATDFLVWAQWPRTRPIPDPARLLPHLICVMPKYTSRLGAVCLCSHSSNKPDSGIYHTV